MASGRRHGAEPVTLLADLLSTVFERRYRSASTLEMGGRPLTELADELISTAGEDTGQLLAREILSRFDTLDDTGKHAFFTHLTTVLDIDAARVRETLKVYESDKSKSAYRAFAQAAEPKRQELIRRLNQVPGATGKLVRMRADLIRLAADDPALKALDLDFRHLFASWFNRGFLVLRPISWESPAHILEKIIAYEAVHAIDSWDDLRRRLEPRDRRCFAFFHPAMPDEPLIFVEVALTKGIPGSVQTLLAQSREIIEADDADTAVFYSISNCQSGLASISFGNSLIKQVVADLSLELPRLKTFVTLSPIPGLINWLESEQIAFDRNDPDTMRGLAAYYLLSAKRPDHLPVDPVARFHLGNGALVYLVHAGADTSEKGQNQSAGVMVNYLYDLKKVSSNHEQFASRQEVAVSSDVRALASAVEKALAKGA